MTFYLSNAQIRPVGYEAAEFIDVRDEPDADEAESRTEPSASE